MELQLKELLALNTGFFQYEGDDDHLEQTIRNISIDSRTIQSGEVYIALKGATHDGHDYAKSALKAGALAAVVESRFWNENKDELHGKLVFVVKDTLLALQQIANYYRKKFNIPVIAITGTNGKTTNKEMIAAVLEKSGQVCKTDGNFNNHIGVPLTLFKLTSNDKFAVVEMGTNHFGEIVTLCKIAEPNYGMITNIGNGHTEFLKDIAGVTKAKMELFDYLKNSGGTVFVNMEDPNISKNAKDFPKKKTFGFSGQEDISAKDVRMNELGCASIKIDDNEINLNLPGQHNAINALAAVAIGSEFGISLTDTKTALENIIVPSKRMEVFKSKKVTIINDCYNANPESTLSALKTLSGIQSTGKKYVIFGDMLELGADAEEQHAKIGRGIAAFGVAAIFAFGNLAKHAIKSAPRSIQKQHFENKTDLIKKLKSVLAPGDLVLIKGSRGMKMEEVLEEIME